MKLSVKQLKQIVAEENEKLKVKQRIKEDIMRGVPDFVINDAASNCSDYVRRHLTLHINQIAQDPTHRRRLQAAALVTLKEIESEVSDIIKEKLQNFLAKS